MREHGEDVDDINEDKDDEEAAEEEMVEDCID